MHYFGTRRLQGTVPKSKVTHQQTEGAQPLVVEFKLDQQCIDQCKKVLTPALDIGSPLKCQFSEGSVIHTSFLKDFDSSPPK